MFLFKKIHDIFLHCLNAEGQFGAESPETNADVITISHASKSGQTRYMRNLFVLLQPTLRN